MADLAQVGAVTGDPGLAQEVRSGLLWKGLNSIVLRLGGLITSIVLARVLDPSAFGVMAIALTVQTVLMTMSELGLAADLVRHGDIDRRGPTIATLAAASSAALTVLLWTCAAPVAAFMSTPSATPVVQVLSLTLFLAGMAVVPYARLQRDLRQRALFGIELVAFVMSTGLSIGLALAGWGALGIATGQVASLVAVVVLEYVVTRTRPRFGWDAGVAVSGLRFGFPLACAGLMSLALLNVDNVVVGRLAGATMLGYYALAFNVSSWPSAVIGQAVRSVAMPAFARRALELGRPDHATLTTATALTWAVAVPSAAGLGVLAQPLVHVLYGRRWDAAATVLVWLAVLGAVRILTDVWVAYLTAAGHSGLLVVCQALWLLSLAPALWWGVSSHALVGAGIAHVVVAAFIIVPAFLVVLRQTGVPVRPVLTTLITPAFAGVAASVAGVLVVRLSTNPWADLLVGGTTVVVVYLALAGRWISHRLPDGIIRHRVPASVGWKEQSP